MTKSLHVIFICKENSKNFTYKKLGKGIIDFSDIKPDLDLQKMKRGLLEIPCQSDKIISRIDNGRENKL